MPRATSARIIARHERADSATIDAYWRAHAAFQSRATANPASTVVAPVLGGGEDPSEPRSFREALANEVWRGAIEKEIASIMKTGTLEEVKGTPPPGSEVIGVLWTFKAKRDAQGKFEKAKARMVARGDHQDPLRAGATAAPTAKLTTVLSALGVAAAQRKTITKMDVSSAYLHAELPQQDLYLKPHDPLTPTIGNRYWRLRRSLYGLRQAGCLWNALLTSELLSLGYERHRHVDHCLFTKSSKGEHIIVVVHVDDLLCVHDTDSALLRELWERLDSRFGVTAETRPSSYLGMHINYSIDGFIVSAPAYIRDCARSWGMTRPLTWLDVPEYLLAPKTDDEMEADVLMMQTLLGELNYICTSVRPEITVVLRQLQRQIHKSSPRHTAAALRILAYLIGSADHGRRYQCGNNTIEAFADADFGADDGRSTSGAILMYAGAPIATMSAVQTMTGLATAASELMATSDAARLVMETIPILTAMKQDVRLPITIHNDNSSAVVASRTFDHKGKFRYLGIRERHILDAVAEGKLRVAQVGTLEQPADILTKVMRSRGDFERLRSLMGICVPDIPTTVRTTKPQTSPTPSSLSRTQQPFEGTDNSSRPLHSPAP